MLGDPLDPSSSEAHQDADDLPTRPLHAALLHVSSRIEARRTASLHAGVYLSLPYLAQLFQLTAFEEQCLLVCLAPELDRKYEKLYAYLQDDVTRKKPSVDLVLKLLCETMPEKLAARLAFDPELSPDQISPLADDRCLAGRTIAFDFAFPETRRPNVNFLLGFEQIDARLESFGPACLWADEGG